MIQLQEEFGFMLLLARPPACWEVSQGFIMVINKEKLQIRGMGTTCKQRNPFFSSHLLASIRCPYF